MRTCMPLLAMSLAAAHVLAQPVVPAEAPGEVVRRLLSAQARADIDAMFALADTRGVTQLAIDQSRALFTKVNEVVTIADLQIDERATLLGDEGNNAFWRAVLRYTLTTPDGSRPIEVGILAHLRHRRDTGSWLIANIYPDELLNLELLEARRAASPAKAGSTRSADAVSYAEINKIIASAGLNRYVNDRKLALTLAVHAIGSYPIAGDGVAITYELLNVVVDAAETIVELKNRGFSVIAVNKIGNTAAGIVQVAAEVVPGVDNQVDAMALALEHMGYNLELQRAMLELKDRIRGIQATGEIAYRPQLFALTTRTGIRYPQGIEVFAEDGQIAAVGETESRPFGFPVYQVNIHKPDAFDQWAGFQLLGELRIGLQDEAWQFLGKFPELGALRSGDDYVLAVDVTSLMQEIKSEGDPLLDNPQVMVGEAANLLMFAPTCRRGLQSLTVVLKNGETTQTVKVVATLMNRITGFEIRSAPRGISRIELGQTIPNLTIHGLGPGLRDSDPNSPPPDLTALPACLDMASSAPNVVELARNKTFSLKALAPGKSDLQLLLIGSAISPDHPEVAASFPMEVAGLTMEVSDKAAMNFYRSSWNFTLEYQLKALSGGFTVLSKTQNLQFGTQNFSLDLRGAPAKVTPAEIDAFELTVKVTDLKALKGQTLEPGYAWMPYFNFIDNTPVKGPSATFRFQVTRGKTFSTTLGVEIKMFHTATGNASNGDKDAGLFLSVVKNP